jgi:hypothetical protein
MNSSCLGARCIDGGRNGVGTMEHSRIYGVIQRAAETDREPLPDDPEDALFVVARKCIGKLGVKEAQKMLRVAMFREVLCQQSGNRHATARVLRVDRRYVLKMVKEVLLDTPSSIDERA